MRKVGEQLNFPQKNIKPQPASEAEKMKISKVALAIALCFCIMLVNQSAHAQNAAKDNADHVGLGVQ
jgi:hypothetical protein